MSAVTGGLWEYYGCLLAVVALNHPGLAGGQTPVLHPPPPRPVGAPCRGGRQLYPGAGSRKGEMFKHNTDEMNLLTEGGEPPHGTATPSPRKQAQRVASFLRLARPGDGLMYISIQLQYIDYILIALHKGLCLTLSTVVPLFFAVCLSFLSHC